jgi:hypothetical protein
MSPKNTHLPTLAWVGLFLVAGFLIYHFAVRGR